MYINPVVHMACIIFEYPKNKHVIPKSSISDLMIILLHTNPIFPKVLKYFIYSGILPYNFSYTFFFIRVCHNTFEFICSCYAFRPDPSIEVFMNSHMLHSCAHPGVENCKHQFCYAGFLWISQWCLFIINSSNFLAYLLSGSLFFLVLSQFMTLMSPL